MTPEHPIPLRIWLATWRAWQRYYHYEVENLDALLGAGMPCLIVGYHGRPFAWDLCLLTVELYDALGYVPAGITHRAADRVPPLKWLLGAMDLYTSERDPRLDPWIRSGRHLMVAPGGIREGARSYRHRYEVDWGDRAGYVRLAVKKGLAIVPVGASGVDNTYIGLNDATALGTRLGLPRDLRWLPWLALGPFGVFPFSPPFRVKIRQLIGAPIVPEKEGVTDPEDGDGVGRLHRKVAGAVQTLLREARLARPARPPGPGGGTDGPE